MANPTVQNIIDGTSQDIRQLLNSSSPGNDQNILIDYCNRISLAMLRASRWDFLLSSIQRFITEKGQTDYWIGTAGSNPAGTVDTGLNITSFQYIKPKSVFDRSNFHLLTDTPDGPNAAKLRYADSTSRMGRPSVYVNSPDKPNVISIFPAPDNQNTYQPVPETPICTTTVSGALAGRLYYVTVTFVDTQGNESTAPPSCKVYIPANSLVTVNPPIEPELTSTSGVKYDHYKVYASTTLGQECVQNGGATISTGSSWTEPTSGLVTNTTFPPTTNSVMSLDGYIIEFRYYAARTQLTAVGNTLQIPADYKDVIIAGVNWLTAKYLARPQEAAEFQALFADGVRQMVRDRNFTNRYADFIGPDPASIGNFLPAVESIDLSVLVP